MLRSFCYFLSFSKIIMTNFICLCIYSYTRTNMRNNESDYCYNIYIYILQTNITDTRITRRIGVVKYNFFFFYKLFKMLPANINNVFKAHALQQLECFRKQSRVRNFSQINNELQRFTRFRWRSLYAVFRNRGENTCFYAVIFSTDVSD